MSTSNTRMYLYTSKFLYLQIMSRNCRSTSSYEEQQLLLWRTTTRLLWRFIHHLPSHTKLSRITPSQLCKHAAGITETLVWTGCCLDKFFVARLTGSFPSLLGYLLHLLLRRTFTKLSRNENLSADPSHQQGAHQTKSRHQGPCCLALAKPHFWKLRCCRTSGADAI